jgi:CDP-paratose 2-epimerase
MILENTAPILVTGGAGFIGCNVAAHFADSGLRVRVFDNFTRRGVDDNARWLERTFPGRVEIVRGDVRDAGALRAAMNDVQAVFHLAAQVAVTTSLDEPRRDFEVNAQGTLEVLEAVRKHAPAAPLIFTSTNKVYGALDDIPLVERGSRWEPRLTERDGRGVSERRSLSCCSPYGCSKGAADQYVLDYARTFGLRTVVFRMSCIYGPHQHGNEDQGWVAHFIREAIAERPTIIFGDGKQVRDLLFVDDLVDGFARALRHIDTVSGRAFNIGGGAANSSSLREVLALIAELRGSSPAVTFRDWRTSDQRYYVSDTQAFQEATQWRPRTSVRDGVAALYRWLSRAAAERASFSVDAQAQVAALQMGGGNHG